MNKDWKSIIHENGLNLEGLIQSKDDLFNVLKHGYAIRLRNGSGYLEATKEMQSRPYPHNIPSINWPQQYTQANSELIAFHANRIVIIPDPNDIKIGDIYRGGIVSHFHQPNKAGYEAGYTRQKPGGLLTYFYGFFPHGSNKDFAGIKETAKEIDKKTGFSGWRLPTDEELIELRHLKNRLTSLNFHGQYVTSIEDGDQFLTLIIEDPRDCERVYKEWKYKRYGDLLDIVFVQPF